MNSSSSPLQDSISFLVFIIFYIPFNVFLMAVAAVLFSIINKLLHLHFPTWMLAIGAALLVFSIMYSLIEGLSSQSNSGNNTVYYGTTFIINLLVVILMLTFSGINKFIFSNPSPESFSFEKPQIITITIYTLITGFFAALPLISDGRNYLNDVQNEKQLASIKKSIETDDIKEFTKIHSNNFELWKVKLPDEQSSLLEYVIDKDKIDMAHVLLKDHKELFGYTFKWNIKSQAMVQRLIEDGMNPNQAVEELTDNNHTELVKFVTEKYQPKFDTLVSYIVQNTLRNNNSSLLDYLIRNGLNKDLKESNETIYWLAQRGDIGSVKMLLEKGFLLDTSDNRIIYQAIYSHNLPFLKFLFNYPFNVNTSSDEYTNLENAIIGNDTDIFNFLLTQKPDVTTIHPTKLNGETNALLIAARYKRPEMLEKLKLYAAMKN